MPDPNRMDLPLEPVRRAASDPTESDQPIMSDGQLGTFNQGPERANPEGSSDLSNLALVDHEKE